MLTDKNCFRRAEWSPVSEEGKREVLVLKRD